MEALNNCRKCSILLTEENKVKKENICKSCNNIKNKEWRLRRANNEAPIVKPIATNCSICLIELDDTIRIKHRTICKNCRKSKYTDYVKTKLTDQYNSPNIKLKCNKCSIILNQENQVKNRPVCKSCHNSKCNEYKKNNKEKVSENHKKYYDKNKETISEYYKIHYKENKDQYMETNRKWRNENREIINKKANERFATNPIARLKKNCRKRINAALKNTNSKTSIKLIDCDINFLKEWLNYNFKDGMTFDNYGSYWHVDHVIPCSLFDLSNEDEIKNCFKWTNLQPLEAKLNLSKQNNLDKNEVEQHYIKVKKFATEHKIELKEFNYNKYF
jgi:hypothetical protein